MSRRNHIFAVGALLTGVALIAETAHCEPQANRQGEKARPQANASKVACSQPQPSGVLCDEEEFRRNGRPLMVPPVNGVAFGVSSPPANPTNVFIWMDNQTDQTQNYGMVCNVSFLKAFVLYDSAGNRLLTMGEQRARQRHEANDFEVETCTCCMLLAIAPHTMQVVDSGNLSVAYTLSPGNYFSVPVNPLSRKAEIPLDEKTNKISLQQKNSIKIVIPRDQR